MALGRRMSKLSGCSQMSPWRLAEAKFKNTAVPAGTSQPPTTVSQVVMRRHDTWLELKRSTSSMALGISDGSAHTSSHSERRGSRHCRVLQISAVTASWPANDRP